MTKNIPPEFSQQLLESNHILTSDLSYSILLHPASENNLEFSWWPGPKSPVLMQSLMGETPKTALHRWQIPILV
ncbi:hypothetical protein [Moorena sp. SIO4G3]|uniref:hypothetical protein n=1 Tax=Moorena sp. SIO4G3 TaxID=2607821 RepID=UPI00142C05FB|nr:hypothetical protein [Moorena sp. SIO4G3]NEO81493.1 hypothetical protein [Moorena sp. SIO4G3]